MTKPYIPPQGIYFRLLGVDSNRVLFSRTSQEPNVSSRPVNEKNEDQLFELIPSVDKDASPDTYLIKAKASQMFLYSRYRPVPRIGHNNEGDKAKNWFKLDFGTGKHASHFRLIGQQTYTAIASRRDNKPYLMNFPESSKYYGQYYEDQYFSFLFEDLNVVGVSFNLGSAQPVPSVPFDVAHKKGNNTSSGVQKITFSDSQKQTRTTTFEYTEGFNIAAGTAFKTSIPFIADSGLKVDASKTTTLKWGNSIVQDDTYTFSFEITVPAHTCVEAVARVTYTIVDVPYTVTLMSPSTKQQTTSQGILKGIRKWIVSLESEDCKA